MVFQIALIKDGADYVVGVQQSENLTREEVAIVIDINLDLTEVRMDKVGGSAKDSVAEKSRKGARLATVEAMVDVFKGRMLYSDEELEGHLRERYKSERERRERERRNVKEEAI